MGVKWTRWEDVQMEDEWWEKLPARAKATMLTLIGLLVLLTVVLVMSQSAAAEPSCDQHAGTGECINPPVIWRPDYAG